MIISNRSISVILKMIVDLAREAATIFMYIIHHMLIEKGSQEYLFAKRYSKRLPGRSGHVLLVRDQAEDMHSNRVSTG